MHFSPGLVFYFLATIISMFTSTLSVTATKHLSSITSFVSAMNISEGRETSCRRFEGNPSRAIGQPDLSVGDNPTTLGSLGLDTYKMSPELMAGFSGNERFSENCTYSVLCTCTLFGSLPCSY